MNISEFFEDWFGAKLANSRWSWGAYDEKRDRVLLRVWEDQLESRDGDEFVQVLGAAWETSSAGLPERERHLELVRNGTDAYAVLCRAESTEGGASRKLVDFNREEVLHLDGLLDDGTRVLAKIKEWVPVVSFSPKQTGFRTWIFQANPNQYDVRSALRTYEKLHWRVTRYKREINTGDFVYLWEAGSGGGILASARVLCQPKTLSFGPGDEFLVEPAEMADTATPQVELEIKAVLQHPIPRETLLSKPALRELQILTQPQATNFKVTEGEAQELAFVFALGKVMPPLQFLQSDSSSNGSGPVERFLTMVEAQRRSSKVVELVKSANGHQCQFCGIVLRTPNGPYAEAAHIQPLGRPHNGPDRTANALCLCPNCHVLFDSGAVWVDEDGWVVGRNRKQKLRKAPGHDIGEDYLQYHRENIAAVPER